jgi:CRP-like cAMP-binding protein
MISPERIEGIPLFSQLSAEQRAQLGRWFDEDEAPAGKHLLYEGSSGYDFFVLEEGRASVSRDGRTVAQLGPGDVFGEMVFFDDSRRSADVIADTPVRLLVMFGTRFRELQTDMPAVAESLQRIVRQRAAERAGA